MCGRFTNRLTWEEIVRLYRLTIKAPPHNLLPRYNICALEGAAWAPVVCTVVAHRIRTWTPIVLTIVADYRDQRFQFLVYIVDLRFNLTD